jgi:dipeptide transport system permease protein
MADLPIRDPATIVSRPGRLAEFWAHYSENRGAVIGLAVFLFLVFLAVFADFVSPYRPDYRTATRS